MQAKMENLIAKLPLKYQRTAKQFVKFAATGAFGAVIDFSLFNILVRGLDWDPTFNVLGYPIVGANVISVGVTIFVMFFINKHWTFRDKNEAVVKQGIGYFALNGTTFVLNQILTSFFLFYLPIVGVIFGTQADNAAKALAIGLILFLNFAGSKFLVFRKKPNL